MVSQIRDDDAVSLNSCINCFSLCCLDAKCFVAARVSIKQINFEEML